MSRKQALKTSASPAEQPLRRNHVSDRRCYTAAQIIAFLQISKGAFFQMRRRGQLPFLEELRPRLGRTVRYRADLVDRYLTGNWQAVSKAHATQSAAVSTSTVRTHSVQTGS